MRWGPEGWLTLLYRQVAQALHARGAQTFFPEIWRTKILCVCSAPASGSL